MREEWEDEITTSILPRDLLRIVDTGDSFTRVAFDEVFVHVRH